MIVAKVKDCTSVDEQHMKGNTRPHNIYLACVTCLACLSVVMTIILHSNLEDLRQEIRTMQLKEMSYAEQWVPRVPSDEQVREGNFYSDS